MNIESVLNNPNAYLKWQEPWPGIDESGNKVDCCVTLTASPCDCIRLQRQVVSKLPITERTKDYNKLPDKEVLLDFMANNWAWEKATGESK